MLAKGRLMKSLIIVLNRTFILLSLLSFAGVANAVLTVDEDISRSDQKKELLSILESEDEICFSSARKIDHIVKDGEKIIACDAEQTAFLNEQKKLMGQTALLSHAAVFGTACAAGVAPVVLVEVGGGGPSSQSFVNSNAVAIAGLAGGLGLLTHADFSGHGWAAYVGFIGCNAAAYGIHTYFFQ